MNKLLKDNPYHNKWAAKRSNAGQAGVVFNLSLDEYTQLAEDAGVTPDMIGCKRDSYCLGRVGDTGSYTVDNCRFITVAQNNEERVTNGGAQRSGDKNKGRKQPEGWAEAQAKRMEGRPRPDSFVAAVSKKWVVTHPDGLIEDVNNLDKFCREHGLCRVAMARRANGGVSSLHRGYGCAKGSNNG